MLVTQTRTSAGKLEVLLSGDARAELQRIGDGLDARRPVRVKDEGIVILDPVQHSSPMTMGYGFSREAASWTA